MLIELVPFLMFTAATSFSPGPNNISAMSFGMSLGYKGTVKYIMGIGVGTFAMMLFCAFLAFGLSNLIPQVTAYLKYLGAAYILYLAYKTLQVNYNAKDKRDVKPRFIDGVLLQLVNPKAIFYGMTVYSTFFSALIDYKAWLIVSAFCLGLITFSVVSIWALSGSAIRHFMSNPKIKTMFSIVMALALVYTAFAILKT